MCAAAASLDISARGLSPCIWGEGRPVSSQPHLTHHTAASARWEEQWEEFDEVVAGGGPWCLCVAQEERSSSFLQSRRQSYSPTVWSSVLQC